MANRIIKSLKKNDEYYILGTPSGVSRAMDIILNSIEDYKLSTDDVVAALGTCYVQISKQEGYEKSKQVSFISETWENLESMLDQRET